MSNDQHWRLRFGLRNLLAAVFWLGIAIALLVLHTRIGIQAGRGGNPWTNLLTTTVAIACAGAALGSLVGKMIQLAVVAAIAWLVIILAVLVLALLQI